MASEHITDHTGLSALLGGEGKRLVLRALADGDALTVSELVRRTGLSRNTVNHALDQLTRAALVSRRKQAGRVVAERASEQAELVAGLLSLDHVALEVHPVPGRPLTDEELDSYKRHLATLPRVVVEGEYPDEDRSAPLSTLVIGDPVD